MDALITESRKAFYKALVNVLLIDPSGVPSNADKDNPSASRSRRG